MNQVLQKYLLAAVVILLLGAMMVWFVFDPSRDFVKSVEGLDNRPDSVAGSSEKVVIGEIFESFTNTETILTGKWTRFRGTNFDNISTDKTKLRSSFGKAGVNIVWQKELGEGHAAPVIYNGRVYLLDYNEDKRTDALRCFDLVTGSEIWQRSYRVHIKRNHGMSRTVPAITDSFLVSIGPRCHVMCVRPHTGELLWGVDVEKEYKSEVPFWYTGQCPLIENNIAIIATGGTHLMIAVDCSTGTVIWKTPNPAGHKMSHSSVMPMTFFGKKMYVYSAIGSTFGISAEGDDVGTVLWETTKWAPSVIAPTPILLPGNKIFLTAGYGAGNMLLEILKSGETFAVKVLEEHKPSEGLACEQQTPILYNGYLFGILPKDAGPLRNQFACYSVADIKKVVWASGKTNRFGLGPYILADGKFYILADDGTLTIARATTSGYEQLEQVKLIADGHDAWGPIATADGFMIFRDAKKMVCVDMRAE